jgi:hypothetical protein
MLPPPPTFGIEPRRRVDALLERGWWLPLAVALGWLAFAWTAAIAIDIHNVGGMQDRMIEWSPRFPLAWFRLFSEAHPTEWLQWTLQAVGLVAALVMWRRLRDPESDTRLRTGWFLLAAGLFMMLMEDSQNVRHLVSDSYLIPFFEPRGIASRQVRLVWEVLFYLFLSGLMVGGVLTLLTRVRPDRRTGGIILVGYALYGFAGFSSAARRVFDWQERLGNWAIERWSLMEIRTWALADQQLEAYRAAVEGYDSTLGYVLVDHWVEESVELLSAGFLVTGFLLLALASLMTVAPRETQTSPVGLPAVRGQRLQ